MPSKKTSSDNLAKARQAKLDKLAKQRELDKYIIYDSSDDDLLDDDTEMVVQPPKAKRPTATRAKPKQVRSNKTIEKAEMLKKEIEDLKRELKGSVKKEFVEPKVESEPIPIPTPAPTHASVAITQKADVIRRKLLNF